ncbi:MAG: hypothetical protein Ct9H300mP21_11270 [Pseudomonadota bacterium]|nr:MAG: hypothetical protein Ct9H300mP21_11270 [Pseudomonadota bacterium]
MTPFFKKKLKNGYLTLNQPPLVLADHQRGSCQFLDLVGPEYSQLSIFEVLEFPVACKFFPQNFPLCSFFGVYPESIPSKLTPRKIKGKTVVDSSDDANPSSSRYSPSAFYCLK